MLPPAPGRASAGLSAGCRPTWRCRLRAWPCSWVGAGCGWRWHWTGWTASTAAWPHRRWPACRRTCRAWCWRTLPSRRCRLRGCTWPLAPCCAACSGTSRPGPCRPGGRSCWARPTWPARAWARCVCWTPPVRTMPAPGRTWPMRWPGPAHPCPTGCRTWPGAFNWARCACAPTSGHCWPKATGCGWTRCRSRARAWAPGGCPRTGPAPPCGCAVAICWRPAPRPCRQPCRGLTPAPKCLRGRGRSAGRAPMACWRCRCAARRCACHAPGSSMRWPCPGRCWARPGRCGATAGPGAKAGCNCTAGAWRCR